MAGDIEPLPKARVAPPPSTDIEPISRAGMVPGAEYSAEPVPPYRPGPREEMRGFRSGGNILGDEGDFLPGPAGMRIATETAGAALGGIAGQKMAGQPGLRLGEAVGAAGGALLSEVFDPTEEPIKNALTAGGFTAATGLTSEVGTIGLRKALGKPHEAGQALIRELEKQGKVPPAGAVLDSSFAQDAQSFGGGAFFIGRRVAKALDEAQDVTSQNFKSYISDFQRYHNGAKIAFAAAEKHLAQSGLANARMVQVDPEVIKVLAPAVEIWKRQGVADKFPADLAWITQLDPATVKNLKLTPNEAASLETLLYNRARELRATAGDISTAADAKKLSATVQSVAERVQLATDDAINQAIKNQKLPASYRQELAQGKALWKQWREGQRVEDMFVASTADLAGATPKTRGEALLRQLDKVTREERRLGKELVSPSIKQNVRNYALALQAAKSSSGEGAFKLSVRQMQLVGLSTAAGYLGGGGAGLATGMVFSALSPPALAWVFTNPTANRLMITGLKAEPGSALAARTAREFASLLAANGWMPPERPEAVQPIPSSDASDIGVE